MKQYMLCSWSRIFIVKLFNEGKYNLFSVSPISYTPDSANFNFEGSCLLSQGKVSSDTASSTFSDF